MPLWLDAGLERSSLSVDLDLSGSGVDLDLSGSGICLGLDLRVVVFVWITVGWYWFRGSGLVLKLHLVDRSFQGLKSLPHVPLSVHKTTWT